MQKTYIETWNRLCHEHESCAHEAWQQANTQNPDGSMKTEREYYEDLIWVCQGIVASGGAESC